MNGSSTTTDWEDLPPDLREELKALGIVQPPKSDHAEVFIKEDPVDPPWKPSYDGEEPPF